MDVNINDDGGDVGVEVSGDDVSIKDDGDDKGTDNDGVDIDVDANDDDDDDNDVKASDYVHYQFLPTAFRKLDAVSIVCEYPLPGLFSHNYSVLSDGENWH